MNGSSIVWLIKSGGRVLGPYSREEVIGLLRTREVSIMDEACSPQKRWQPIRSQTPFIRIVDDLIQASHDAADQTLTTSEHLTESITLGDVEVTPGAEGFDKTPNLGSVMREIVYENVEDKIDVQPTTRASRYQMASGSNQQVERVVKKGTNILWAFTIFVVLTLLSFVAVQRFILQPKRVQQAADDAFREGEKALQVGAYKEALVNFKKVNADHPQIRLADYYLGLLLIQEEGQTLIGKRFLSQVMAHSPEKKALALNAYGVAELYEQNLGQAREWLNKALDEQPNLPETHVNLAILDYIERKYPEAYNRLSRVVSQGFADFFAHFFLLQLQTNILEQTGGVKSSPTLAQDLEKFVSTPHAYLQEALLLKVYSELEGSAVAESKVRLLLDVDPYLTESHLRSLLLYQRMQNWEQLQNYCQKIVGNNPAEAYLSALAALCAAKSGRMTEAKTAIERALSQSPKDPQVQSVYAYVLELMGQKEQSSLALGKALELDRAAAFALPLILQAQFCWQSQDWECVQKTAGKLNEKPTTRLQSLAWRAAYEVNAKNKNVSSTLQEGLRLSKDYKPLLSIRERAHELGLIEGGAQ